MDQSRSVNPVSIAALLQQYLYVLQIMCPPAELRPVRTSNAPIAGTSNATVVNP